MRSEVLGPGRNEAENPRGHSFTVPLDQNEPGACNFSSEIEFGGIRMIKGRELHGQYF